MNAGAVIIGIVVVLLVLAVGVFVVTARRHDSRRGEARSRGRPASATGRAGPTRRSRSRPRRAGREVELAAVAAERSAELEKVAPKRAGPVACHRTRRRSVSPRRQFFNRGLVALTSAGLAGFGAATVSSLWARRAASAARSTSASSQSLISRDQSRTGLLHARGPHVGDGVPRPGTCRRPRRSTPRPCWSAMKAGINTLYQKCPHLGCRVPNCDSSQWFSARATAASTTRVGEARWPCASRHGPLPGDHQRRRGHRGHRPDLPRAVHRHPTPPAGKAEDYTA